MNTTTKKKLSIALIATIMAVGIMELITTKINIGFNQSPSVSGRVFLIVKGTLPKKKFDIVSFKSIGELADIKKNGSKYPKGHKSKLKQVIGFGGDVVSVKKNHIYLNNQDLGAIKEYSLKGEELIPIAKDGESLVIPNGSYFVYSKHKDSYDSRYKTIGFVTKEQIIGRAYEIL